MWRNRADTTKLFCVLAVIDICYMTTRFIYSGGGIFIVGLLSINMVHGLLVGILMSVVWYKFYYVHLL